MRDMKLREVLVQFLNEAIRKSFIVYVVLRRGGYGTRQRVILI